MVKAGATEAKTCPHCNHKTRRRSKHRPPDSRESRRIRAAVIDVESHCHICGEAVDKTLRYPDRMSATVDHVTPLALGGSGNRSNLRLAHLRCNLKKAAKPLAGPESSGP
jgi:5-methylcytosine-specific restriction endonuclease McrA